MKKVGEYTKANVIKLFLRGASFDEIAHQLGIAKGSVVNIVDLFRNGDLPAPPGMAEYIDEVRRLVVDLKKHNASIAQAKSCLKIHLRLQEIGARPGDAEQWLETCREIASDSESPSGFVEAALELSRLKSETGLTYEVLLSEISQRIEYSKALDVEIDDKKRHLDELRRKCKSEKSKAAKELESITRATATAQENFAKQTAHLKAQLDQYLAQNKLDWYIVKTATALIDSVLGSVGLDRREIDELSAKLAATGSLVIVTKQLDQQRNELKSEMKQLVEHKSEHAAQIDQLTAKVIALSQSLEEKRQEQLRLDAELQVKMTQLDELNRRIQAVADETRANCLITRFLASPLYLSDEDFEQFRGLILDIRRSRLVYAQRWIQAQSDTVTREVLESSLQRRAEKLGTDSDRARKILARYLLPLLDPGFDP